MRIHSDKNWFVQSYQFALLSDRERFHRTGDKQQYRSDRSWHLRQCAWSRASVATQELIDRLRSGASIWKRPWCWFTVHPYVEINGYWYFCQRCGHSEKVT